MMENKRKNRIFLILLLLLFLIVIPITFSKYITKITRSLILNAVQPEYGVYFHHLDDMEDVILPDDYQKLDYIRSTGFQYIDTGVAPTNTLKTEIDYVDININNIKKILKNY